MSTAEERSPDPGRPVELGVGGERRRCFCREWGPAAAPVLVFLHGGWGYEAYPLPEATREALVERFRLLIPDRSGYGRSLRREALAPGFHRDAALETLALEGDHGPGWREVLAMEGRAWLEILDSCDDPERDLFGGRLADLVAPALVLHGERDPRTEPGELDALLRQLPHATLHLEARGGHSPHSESRVAESAGAVARRFLTGQTRALESGPGG